MKTFVLSLLILVGASASATVNLSLLGKPGSGKGTTADKLARRYGVPAISSGDIVRDQIARGTPFGLRAKETNDRGLLLPDTPEGIGPLIDLLAERIQRPDANEGFVLDGFPRTEYQALALDKILRGLGRRLDAVVLIDVPDDVVISRLAARRVCSKCKATYNSTTHAPRTPGVCDDCGEGLARRADDLPGVVAERLHVYGQSIGPVIEYYRAQGQLVTVDGQAPNEDGLRELYERLDQPYPRGYLQQRIPAYLDPTTGVRMYNLVEMWKDPGLGRHIVDRFRDIVDASGAEYLAAPEARALPFWGALLYLTGKPGIFIRKANKIPTAVPRLIQTYAKSTSADPDVIEMTDDPNLKGKTVVLIDDGLSSGGTTAATVDLLERAGMKVVRVLIAIRYHYRAPCAEFLEKKLDQKTTTLFDLN